MNENRQQVIEVKDNNNVIDIARNLFTLPYITESLVLIFSLILSLIIKRQNTVLDELNKIIKKDSKTHVNKEKALELQEILYNILHETNADRVCLLEFHNGENRSRRKYHYIKSSITFEVTKPGISKISSFIRDIPLTIIINELEELNKSDKKYLKLTNNNNNNNNNEIEPTIFLKVGIQESYIFKISNVIEDGLIIIMYEDDSLCFNNCDTKLYNLCLSEENTILLNQILLLVYSIRYYLNY